MLYWHRLGECKNLREPTLVIYSTNKMKDHHPSVKHGRVPYSSSQAYDLILGEEPLVDWEVGLGMRKSELRTPRRRCGCCGKVAPMIGDGSLRVVLEMRRFIVFRIRK
ncbi:hypothetical protein CMV_019830 [Castanea mollissima]|uniref:Uncharacterized protein n=1 Tax=Castanea mollissima TaxID=60419 RepID=A0A8J4VGB0_9ROSI|nr:hypothetical protein CMV_019830 [Castanea mollissima]